MKKFGQSSICISLRKRSSYFSFHGIFWMWITAAKPVVGFREIVFPRPDIVASIYIYICMVEYNIVSYCLNFFASCFSQKNAFVTSSGYRITKIKVRQNKTLKFTRDCAKSPSRSVPDWCEFGLAREQSISYKYLCGRVWFGRQKLPWYENSV